jgi:hypothetical protein
MRTVTNKPYARTPDGKIVIIVGRKKAKEQLRRFIAMLDKMPRTFKRYGRE